RASALLAQSEARFKHADEEAKRVAALYPKDGLTAEVAAKIQGEFAKIQGERVEAEGAVRVARAGMDLAQLNLSFTKVSAPIDGSVGRLPLSAGSLVKADETKLGTLTSRDPLVVAFDIDEKTAIALRRRFATEKGNVKNWSTLPAAIA